MPFEDRLTGVNTDYVTYNDLATYAGADYVNTITTHGYGLNLNIDGYVKESELNCKFEELIKKIYNIIKDSTRLDISEEDFIKLLQE